MKQAITSSYTFSPATQQLSLGIPGFSLARLYAVINQTSGNQVVYAAGGGPGLAATAGTGGVITLAANLTGMSPTDSLLILYETTGPVASNASLSVTPASDMASGDVPGALTRGPIIEELLSQLLIESRLTNMLLQHGLAITDPLEGMRTDLSTPN